MAAGSPRCPEPGRAVGETDLENQRRGRRPAGWGSRLALTRGACAFPPRAAPSVPCSPAAGRSALRHLPVFCPHLPPRGSLCLCPFVY